MARCWLAGPARSAADLLALVAGQDVAAGEDGVFRIVRGVARDRVISTVDVEARHGHKSHNRHFDGYKAHISVDPDSELIDEVAATAANTADREAIEALTGHLDDQNEKPVVVGDSAYADGATRAGIAERGLELRSKCPPVRNSTGGYTKDDFDVDLEQDRVTCPAGRVAPIRFGPRGHGKASFKAYCAHCPLKEHCTPSKRGRTISIHPQERLLQAARAEQASPDWQAAYRADRPVMERKIAHLVRRPWGGRKARTRGRQRVNTDLHLRAAALNWARLAVLGLHYNGGNWALS